MADFAGLIQDAFKFATPFAQKYLGQSTTPAQIQTQTLRDASLNGSGPNDPTLAKQAPLGLMDYITGLSGGRGAGEASVAGGLKTAGGIGWGMIAVAVAAVVAVILIIRK